MTGRTRVPTRASARGERKRLEKLSESITDRDVEILLYLHEHKVLTTRQIAHLCFSSESRAQARLARLEELEVIRRTRPPARVGSLPKHAILDTDGAVIVAEHLGIGFQELGFRRDRGLGLINSPRLRHLRDTNTFFSVLAHACRLSSALYQLVEWKSEEACARRWSRHVTPDGLGVLQSPQGRVSFLLELDRGTENRGRLAQKIRKYRLIAGGHGAPQVLLFCFPTEPREASAREALEGSRLIVATTTLERHAADPLGAVWRPLRADHRVPLFGLTPGEPV
ncbi:MAG: replication-relaxation family protein [Actinomycetota bacterium]